MITPEQETAIQASLKNTGLATAPQVTNTNGSWYTKLRSETPAVTDAPAPTPGYGADLMGQYDTARQKIGASVTEGADNLQKDLAENDGSLGGELGTAAKVAGHAVETGLGTAAGATQALFAPATAGVERVSDAVSNTKGAQEAAASRPISAILNLTGAAGAKMDELAQLHPEVAKNITDAITVGTAGLGEGATGTLGATDIAQAGKGAIEAAKGGAGAVKDAAAGAIDAVKTKVTPTTPTPAEAKIAAEAKSAAGRKVIVDALQKIADKYPSTVGKTLMEHTDVNGTDPLGVISSYGKDAIPTVNERGMVDTNEQQAFLNNRIGELSKVKNEALFTNDSEVPVSGFAKYAKDLIDAHSSWSEAKKEAAHAQLDKEFKALASTYKDKPLNMTELDKIKTEQTALSKTYNNSGAKPFELDTHGIIGKAARQLVEMHTDDAPTHELNKLTQSHYDAIELLDKMQGKAPNGGMLSKALGRMTGEITGAVAGGAVGHPFIGAMTGRVGSDMVTGVLNNHFISNPLKRQLIGSLEHVEPEVKAKMLQYIDENSPGIDELGDRGEAQGAKSAPQTSAKTTAKTTVNKKVPMKGTIRRPK